MYRSLLCAAIAATVIATMLMPAGCAAQDGRNGVTVSGTAEVKGRPDVAYISFGVQTEDRDAATAAQANAAATTAVIDAIVKFGVPKSEIETTQYSIMPIVDYQKNPPVTTGYRVTNQVRARLRDLSKVGALIDVGVAAGANNVQGIAFDIENQSSLRREALVQAMKNAETDAKLIAQTLGIKLGKVTSVSVSGPVVPRPMEYGMMKADVATTPIIPGQITVSASVTVVYAVL